MAAVSKYMIDGIPCEPGPVMVPLLADRPGYYEITSTGTLESWRGGIGLTYQPGAVLGFRLRQGQQLADSDEWRVLAEQGAEVRVCLFADPEAVALKQGRARSTWRALPR